MIPLAGATAIDLPMGSWSKMLVTRGSVADNATSLGFSTFVVGSRTDLLAHVVEELAFVVSGEGELRLQDERSAPFKAGDALFIPPRLWHAVVNTGAVDMTMVFTFAHPTYPPTERRTSSAT